MAAVSTSAKVFMCKLQSIIDSKNKEAANKFHYQVLNQNQNNLLFQPHCVIHITMSDLGCHLL